MPRNTLPTDRRPAPRSLRSLWDEPAQACGVGPVIVARCFVGLIEAYSGPGRYYHTLVHVRHVLDVLRALRGRAACYPALQWAAWFHDVVYDPRAGDNEERSADYAAAVLTRMQAPADLVARTRALVLDTRAHQPRPGDGDSGLFLDADLAVLGAPLKQYRAYARAIRLEYDWVPGRLYRARRRAILEAFLRRPRIYFTEEMAAAREARARENLAWEIGRLGRGGRAAGGPA